MAARLPSLNALKAFGAAARHLSFTRAAEELCVTHGAVSRHIANLEAELGITLFIRKPHLELTRVAKTYLASVEQAFDIIRTATEGLESRSDASGKLRIRALQTIVSRWLLPRLQSFGSSELQISLATIDTPTSFDKDDIDVSIEAGPSNAPRTKSYRLLDLDLIPICHPNGANGLPPPRNISDLREYTLLHSTPGTSGKRQRNHDFWAQWFDHVRMTDISRIRSSHLPTFDLVYLGVLEGLGIGISARCFIREDLAAGRIITPFDISIRSPLSYYLIIPEAKADLKRVQRFKEWILDQAMLANART